jgi:hypothetical protein
MTMAKFVKIGDRVIDLESVVWLEFIPQAGADLFYVHTTAAKPIAYKGTDAAMVYRMLLDALQPQTWKPPAAAD